MKCRICGNELPDSARFCNVCGTPQQEQPAPEEALAPTTLDETAPAPAEEAPAQPVDGAEAPADAPAADAAQPTLPEDPEQPLWNADVPQGYVVNPAYETPPAPKKHNRRKILAITLPSVAVVLVAAALALYFLVFNTPTYRLMRAAKRTGELLQAQFVDCTNLKRAVQNAKTLNQKDELSVELNVESAGDERTYETKMACRVDVSRAERKALMTVSSESDDSSFDLTFADFDGTAYLTSDRMLSGDVYSLPLENLGKELKDSALAEALGLDVDENLSIDIFTDASFATYRASNPAAWTDFTDSLEVESLGKEDGDTRYRVTADAEALQALVEDYLRYQSDAIYGKDVVDVAVDELFGDDDEAELTVGVRDGLLRVTRNGKVRELHYSTENDGLKLTMQSADGVDLELAVMPYDPIELDTSGAESLLDMTSTELQLFAMKIYTNLSR